MKKSILLGMPKLTASPEMKKVALEDEPEKVRTYSGYTRIRRKYKCYMNCMVQNGILKVALYLPDHLRLDGDNPAYEVFLDKKKRQFLTYDYLDKKWRDAKLDRLEWPGQDYDAVCWVSTGDSDMVQQYFSSERGGYFGILDFQRKVREEQLDQRHRRITDPWDKDLAQVPELPKDWGRWADKVAVRENFIFYNYKRGGAKTGYCTSAGRMCLFLGIPTTTKRDCIRCRHPVVLMRWAALAIFRRRGIMLILSSGVEMGLLSENSGRTGPIESTVCPIVNLIGMRSGVRFMTAAEKSDLITGECTAKEKCAGSWEAPAITTIAGISLAGCMERLCPAWGKKNFARPAWLSGYEAIPSLILKNTWRYGKNFPRWSRSGRLDCRS